MIERPGHHTIFHKNLAGWCIGGELQRVYLDGDYGIAPTEQVSSAVKGITFNVGTRHYYIEYRQPIGMDEHLFQQPVNTQGVLISLVDYSGVLSGLDYAGNPSGRGPWLLDMTPNSASGSTDADTYDSALTPGNFYTDGTVTIRCVSADSNGAVVHITGLPQPPLPAVEIPSGASTPPPTTVPSTTARPTTTRAPSLIHYEYRVDGGPWSSTSTQTVSVAGLAPGPHVFEVRAWDGTSYSPIGEYDWQIATTEVSLDTAGWQPAIPPIEFDNLGVGQHIFQVRGVYANNTRSPITSYTWTIGSPTTTNPGLRSLAGKPLVRWHMVLYDKLGNVLAPIETFVNGKFTVIHNGIDGLGFDIFIDDEIAGLFSELNTYVKLWRSMDDWNADPNFPDFAGVVGPIQEAGSNRTATIQCWSPFYQLQARLAFELLQYGVPQKTTDAVDQGEILWNLISYTNARHPTNIVRGTIEQTVARRMQYDRGQNIWSAIQDMTTVFGGVDIWPTYVHMDGDPTLCRFNCGYVNGIYNPNARIDYFGGTNNCTDMTRQSSVDPSSVATYIEEDGQGSANSAIVPFATAFSDADINDGIGLWEELDSQSNVSDVVLLQAFADELLVQKKQTPKTIQPTVSPVLSPWYRRHYAVGDVLPTTAQRGRMTFGDNLRVFQAEMDLAPSGEETTTLTLAKDLQGVVQGVPTAT